jgi:hypothetical protein
MFLNARCAEGNHNATRGGLAHNAAKLKLPALDNN